MSDENLPYRSADAEPHRSPLNMTLVFAGTLFLVIQSASLLEMVIENRWAKYDLEDFKIAVGVLLTYLYFASLIFYAAIDRALKRTGPNAGINARRAMLYTLLHASLLASLAFLDFVPSLWKVGHLIAWPVLLTCLFSPLAVARFLLTR